MRGLRAVIAEDEPVLRSELRDTLAKIWPELEICAEAEDGIEALRALNEHAPDILFLDIQMPGMTGLEVAQQASGRAHVAFVTAYDKFAIAAFEQGAVDYVMKPISPARIASTVARLKERLKAAPANLDGILKSLAQAVAPKEYLHWITAASGGELQLITIDEICYFESEAGNARAVTSSTAAIVAKPVAELASDLDPAVFVPVSKSAMVNINAIATVARDTRGRLQVQFKQRKETVEVDPAYASLVAKATGLAIDAGDDRRQLATVLFTDIVDSTATASRLGDRAWHQLLIEHDHICRAAIERFRGRLVKSTGDGVFATFDGPARAVRCAATIGESVRDLGLAVRAGVHTGECEEHQGDLRGIAVHIGARIGALAGPGEVLVSETVRDLVGGSGILFTDRGMHSLKGVTSPVHVLAVAST